MASELRGRAHQSIQIDDSPLAHCAAGGGGAGGAGTLQYIATTRRELRQPRQAQALPGQCEVRWRAGEPRLLRHRRGGRREIRPRHRHRRQRRACTHWCSSVQDNGSASARTAHRRGGAAAGGGGGAHAAAERQHTTGFKSGKSRSDEAKVWRGGKTATLGHFATAEEAALHPRCGCQRALG